MNASQAAPYSPDAIIDSGSSLPNTAVRRSTLRRNRKHDAKPEGRAGGGKASPTGDTGVGEGNGEA